MNLLNLLVCFFFIYILTLKINAKCNPIPFFPKAGDINSPIFLFNFETIQCQNRFVLTRPLSKFIQRLLRCCRFHGLCYFSNSKWWPS